MSMSATDASTTGALRFLHTCARLKTTKRTGWIKHGVPNPESISDHMHRMSIIALLIKDPSIDRSRLVKMAAVHDLAEAVVGDITPNCGVSKEEKQRLEREAMDSFVADHGASQQILEIKELWEEYERCDTPESTLCKDIDKFEMILQAFEYEKETGKRLDDFYNSTKGIFTHPEIVSLVNDLYMQRKSELDWEV